MLKKGPRASSDPDSVALAHQQLKVQGISYYTPWGPPPSPPPPKSDKTLYTGIYLPTFREGTNFIIKLLVSCLGALTGPGGGPP